MSAECACGPQGVAATSGLMALTGRADGPPLSVPPGVVTAALGYAQDIARLTDGAVDLDGPALLGERAALEGLRRRGPWSAGGRTRAIRTADGWVAVSLARDTDRDAVPAVVSDDTIGDPWQQLSSWSAVRPCAEVVERATLLEVPAATIPSAPLEAVGPAVAREPIGSSLAPSAFEAAVRGRPLVVDLSSLWAGPLCAHVLGLAGHRVVKVESVGRLDAARWGNPRLYATLHSGHESVLLDFTRGEGRARLRSLVRAADVVIEASRPRALRALGISPEQDLAQGATWVGITAHGREGASGVRVGFGDDVAAGAGGWVVDPATGEPLPTGDALADPLTGLAAAVAVLQGRDRPGRELLDVTMSAVVAAAVGAAVTPVATATSERAGGWFFDGAGCTHEVLSPRGRPARGVASGPGADTDRVLAEIGSR